ncbi:MAG: hypothetical protein R3B92_02155 [Patescibacteria group bacterium]
MQVPKKIVLALYLVISISTFTKVLLADIYNKGSLQALKQTKFEQALAFANTAVSLNNNEPYYYRTLAKADLANNKVDDALTALKSAQDLNKNNLATTKNMIGTYYIIGLTNPDIAKNYFLKMQQSYSKDLGVQISVATYQNKLGWEEEFKDSKEQIYKLRADILDWYIF